MLKSTYLFTFFVLNISRKKKPQQAYTLADFSNPTDKVLNSNQEPRDTSSNQIQVLKIDDHHHVGTLAYREYSKNRTPPWSRGQSPDFYI